MYESIPNELRTMEAGSKRMEPYKRGLLHRAASAIEKMNQKIGFLMNCIYEAEDALDRGTDNEWARAALEKAERGPDA